MDATSESQWGIKLLSKHHRRNINMLTCSSNPIGSMYAIYGNIYHQYTPVMLAYIPYIRIRHGNFGHHEYYKPNHQSWHHGSPEKDRPLGVATTVDRAYVGIVNCPNLPKLGIHGSLRMFQVKLPRNEWWLWKILWHWAVPGVPQNQYSCFEIIINFRIFPYNIAILGFHPQFSVKPS